MPTRLFSQIGQVWGCLLLLSVLSLATAGCGNEEPDKPEIIREGPPPLENPQYVDLGTFVVNMPGDKYFLKSSIQIAFNHPIPRTWLELRLPIVKDMLVSHLQTITLEQFDDLRSRPIIKNNLKLRLNSLFPNKTQWEDQAPVKKILFSEFYRQ